jgi:hypothetical protein
LKPARKDRPDEDASDGRHALVHARRGRPPWWLFASIALAAAVIVPCAQSALAWVGRPFGSLLFADQGIVVSIGRASWRDPQLRRAEWSRIVAVNGTPVETAAAIHEAVARAGIGQSVTYTLRRDSDVFRVRIPVREFTWDDFAEIFAPLLGMGTALFAIGAIVVILRPDLREVHALFAVCALLGLSLVTGPDQYGPYRFTAPYLVSLALVPPAILHLTATFPWRPGRWAMRSVVALYAVFAGVGGLLVAVRSDTGLFLPLLYLVYCALANALLLYIGSLVAALAGERRPRRQLLLALGGVVGSSAIGILVLVSYPLLVEPLSPIWLVLPIALLPILTGLAFVAPWAIDEGEGR